MVSSTENKPDRTEKLVSLTYALTTTRIGYTRAQLRGMVDDYAGLSDEAFERKFERDKETLRNLGVVIVDGKGRGESSWDAGDPERRYRVLPSDYPLPALELEATEAAVLGLAARVVAGGGLGRQAARAAERLGLSTDLSEPAFSAVIDTEAEHLEPLIRHAALGNPVKFTYRTADGRTEPRAVMPWGLGHRLGHWYLAAGDTRRDGERLFRLDRIQGSVAQLSPKADDFVPQAYGRPDRFSMAAALDRLALATPSETARLLVPEGGGGTLAARAHVRTHAADGVHLEVSYRDAHSLAAEVAAEGARVLEPASLAAEVVRVLAAAEAPHRGEAPASRLSARRGGRVAAETTVSRALDLVAFVVQRGAPTPDEVMERFGLSRDELDSELTRLRNCGVPNGLHDELLDVEWDEGSVTISNAQALAEPINLNLAEAAALLIGLDAMSSAPEGSYTAEALGAISTVAARLRALRPELADFEQLLAVRASSRERAGLAAALARASEERFLVELDYAGSSTPGVRVIEPIRVLDVGERSYVQAWCRTRQAPRTFRLDRVVGASVLEEHFAPDAERAAAVRGAVFTPSETDVEATLAWSPAWADRALAHGPLRTGKSGELLATQIRVRDSAYLVRLAASAGGDAVVLEPQALRDATHRALRARLDQAVADAEAAGVPQAELDALVKGVRR